MFLCFGFLATINYGLIRHIRDHCTHMHQASPGYLWHIEGSNHESD